MWGRTLPPAILPPRKKRRGARPGPQHQIKVFTPSTDLKNSHLNQMADSEHLSSAGKPNYSAVLLSVLRVETEIFQATGHELTLWGCFGVAEELDPHRKWCDEPTWQREKLGGKRKISVSLQSWWRQEFSSLNHASWPWQLPERLKRLVNKSWCLLQRCYFQGAVSCFWGEMPSRAAGHWGFTKSFKNGVSPSFPSVYCHLVKLAGKEIKSLSLHPPCPPKLIKRRISFQAAVAPGKSVCSRWGKGR